MMRYGWLVPSLLLICMTSSPLLAARVLVPSDQATAATVVPAEKPELQDVSPAIAPLPAPAPVVSENDSLDEVNKEVLDSVSLSEIKKYLPAEFQDMSEDDMLRLVKDQMQMSKQLNTAEFMTTDPKTGKKVIDYEKIKKFKGGITGPVKIRPGGTLADKPITKEDAMMAKLLASGKYVKEKPSVQQARAFAKEMSEEFRRKYDRPPLVLKVNEPRSMTGSYLKSSFAVAVMDSYIWGNNDAELISRSLGYEREEIPQNCQLRLVVKVQTEDKEGVFNTGLFAGEKDVVAYNGTVLSLALRPYAVCNKPENVPQHGGILFDYAGKYGVLLDNASCQAPTDPTQNRVPVSVGIKFLGDSKVDCAFRLK